MIELRPLTGADIAAHNSGEDADTVRWLSGVAATEESTRRHFATLAENAAQGRGERGFGIWWDGRLAGYIDLDPDDSGLPRPGDVTIAYAVHPWARRRGIAATAVELVCAQFRRDGIGTRAVIRTDRDSIASMRVARHCGFRRTSGSADGTLVFVRDLEVTLSRGSILAKGYSAPGADRRASGRVDVTPRHRRFRATCGGDVSRSLRLSPWTTPPSGRAGRQ